MVDCNESLVLNIWLIIEVGELLGSSLWLLDAQAAIYGAFSLDFLSPLGPRVRANCGAIDILLQRLVLILVLG